MLTTRRATRSPIKGMLRRITAPAIVLAVLMTIPATIPASTDFTKIIPENALMAAWSNDFPTLKEGANASPYGKLWNDPACDKLRSLVDERIKKLEAESEDKEIATLSEITNILKGGVAFYLSQDGEKFESDNMAFTCIVEVDDEGRAWLQEKLKSFGSNLKDPQKDSYETGGTTVYRVKGIPANTDPNATDEHGAPIVPKQEVQQYAFVDQHFVFSDADGDDPIKQAVNALKDNNTVTSLSTREDLRLFATRTDAAPAQFNAFVNSGTLIRGAVEGDPDADPTLKALLPTTGLYDIQSMLVAITMNNKSFDMDMAINTPTEKTGIVKALLAGGATPLNTVRYVPADATSFTSFSLDAGAVYDATMKIAEAVNPEMTALASMMILGQQSQLEVDFINGILRNISGEHLMFSRELDPEIKKQLPEEIRPLQSSQAVYLGLKNGEETVANLKTLIANLQKNPDTAQAIETAEVDGVTVVSIKGLGAEDDPMKPAIAFNKDAIVLCNNGVQLQDSIRSLNGKLSAPMQDQEACKAALSALDKTRLYSFTYSPKASIRSGLRQVQEMAAQGYFNELEGFDPEMIPSPEAAEKYLGDSFSSIHVDDKMIHVNARVLAPK